MIKMSVVKWVIFCNKSNSFHENLLAIKEVDLRHFPADVETEAMLYERAGRFVDYLKERYDGKQVLAVGHGLINRAVQAHIQGVTLEHLRSVPKMNNAELRRFKLT